MPAPLIRWCGLMIDPFGHQVWILAPEFGCDSYGCRLVSNSGVRCDEHRAASWMHQDVWYASKPIRLGRVWADAPVFLV